MSTIRSHAEEMPAFEATPPRYPAPMPRQTIVFWSPRLALAVATVAVGGLKDFKRLQTAQQHATIPTTNGRDERR